MNKKILLFIFIAIFLSVNVSAASNILDMILQPFHDVDIASAYENYSMFVDAVIYLILFISVAQFVYVKAFGKKEGKMIAVAVGLALMIGMMMLEKQTGFKLGQLGPLAATILLFILGFLFYSMINAMFDDAKLSFAITFLLMFGVLMSAFSELYRWLENKSPLLAALLNICLIICFIILIIRMIGLFSDGKPSTNTSTSDTTQPIIDQDTPRDTVNRQSNSINITSPTNGQNFNSGEQIRIAFTVSGPEFSHNFDYDLMVDGRRYGNRITNVGGNQVYPVTFIAGNQIPTGRHLLHVIGVRHRRVFRSNTIIAQSNVVDFTVNGGAPAGGGDLPGIIANNLRDALIQLFQAYEDYSIRFHDLIQMHHDFRARGIGRDPQPVEWADLFARRAAMRNIAQIINRDILSSIYSSTEYAALSPAQLAVLAHLLDVNADIRRCIIVYEIQARAEYNSHITPGAIPRPRRP